MTFPFKPSIEEYLAQRDPYHEAKYREILLSQAKMLAAWGVPSRESLGASHSELVNMIHKLITYIERNQNVTT